MRSAAFAGLVLASLALAQAPVQVTLSPAASPATGEPGVTTINLTGSNFPNGTIPAGNVTISLKPSVGGAAVTTKATAVTTIVATTLRVSFTIPATVSVAAPTAYAVSLSGTTSTNVAFASSNTAALTVNPQAKITSVNPASAQTGQTLSVSIVGSFSNWLQGSTQASFGGAGVTVSSTTVSGATQASANITIAPTATTGARTVTMTTGLEIATLANAFTITSPTSPAPTITSFNPASGPIGTLVTVNGTNFGAAPQIAMSQMGGGTINPIPSTVAPAQLTFAVPSGAATGPISVTTSSGSATSATSFTVTPSASFTLSANPPSASVIQGQSVAYSITLASANGFNQLAALAVTGVPGGVTAAFKPASISAGQTSVLTFTAPPNQPIATSSLTVSAAATISGMPVTQTAPASLSVVGPTTTLLGRTVVADAFQEPLAGVTITTLGQDGNGNTTGCTGHTTVSDAAGNFALTGLPLACTGQQLIDFDGTTATSPPGTYDGVHLAFTLTSGQVTPSPVLVNLPRIDTAEVFYVQQNSPVDQSHSFSSIPGVFVTVYAGTTLTLPNGTQPNPFPISVVQVLPDRLPDQKPVVPTMVGVFYLSFQPTGTHASQPVAVTYPNTLNTAPGTDMPLMVLDATHGTFLPVGTGKVSANGATIVPDPDPAHPGHAYGITNFDW